MPFKPPTHRPSGRPPRVDSQREYDQRRGPERQFHGSTAWRKFRKWFLTMHPLCGDCEKEGRVTVATQVHHVKPRKEFPDLTFDEDNCIGLCAGCHTRRTRAGE
jgi:5-methylcytosine-specific restriction protein A